MNRRKKSPKPFDQPLALHSRVSYTGASLNLADDAEEVLLRSAEMGAGLQYTLTAQSARVLQDSTYSEFYGADASLVLDDITAQVAQYRQTLSGIFNQEMTGHERVGNVTITTYANGTRVYVNFGYTDAAVVGRVNNGSGRRLKHHRPCPVTPE